MLFLAERVKRENNSVRYYLNGDRREEVARALYSRAGVQIVLSGGRGINRLYQDMDVSVGITERGNTYLDYPVTVVKRGSDGCNAEDK